FPCGTRAQRGPDALQLGGDVVGDSRAGRLRVPVHARQLAGAQLVTWKQEVVRRVEEHVVDEIDVVAISGTAPIRSFVPIGERSPRGEQPAWLARLAQHEQAIAAPDLLAARAAPAVAHLEPAAHPAGHPSEARPRHLLRLPG